VVDDVDGFTGIDAEEIDQEIEGQLGIAQRDHRIAGLGGGDATHEAERRLLGDLGQDPGALEDPLNHGRVGLQVAPPSVPGSCP
jgi:hypothetical protein